MSKSTTDHIQLVIVKMPSRARSEITDERREYFISSGWNCGENVFTNVLHMTSINLVFYWEKKPKKKRTNFCVGMSFLKLHSPTHTHTHTHTHALSDRMVRVRSQSTHVSRPQALKWGALLLLSPPFQWKLSQTRSGHVTTAPLPHRNTLTACKHSHSTDSTCQKESVKQHVVRVDILFVVLKYTKPVEKIVIVNSQRYVQRILIWN